MNMDGSSSNNNTQDVERKENQIFVRNLAYSTTSEDLMGLFEEFGPMKRATIVQKDGVSRGFGFVKFALEEDANAAVRALQGRELNGRAMKLEIAVQRGQSTKGGAGDVGANGGVEMNDEEKEASKSTPSLSVPNSLNTSNNHLQVIVTGVPTHINKKVFRDAVVKSLPFKCKKILIDLIKSDHEMYAQLCPESLIPAGRVMLLTVPSRQDVPKVVSHLDGMTVKALGLSTVSEEKGTEVKCKLTCRSLKDVTPVDSRKQKCRLILRNLSFQAVEENVATRLLKFGPLVEVSIPRIEVDHSKTEGGAKNGYAKNRFEKKQQQGQKQLKPRGFAFVMFLCEKDAASAVSGCEGLKICNREFALDFCQHKYGYGFANENEEEEGAKEDEEAKDEVKEDGDESGEDEGTSDSDADSADGSDDENDDDKSDSGSVDDDASDYSGEEMKVNDSDEESEPGSEMEWDGSDSDESDDEDESSKTKKSESASKKPVSTDVNEKRTVFVRDLAFDADQNDVKKVFRQFGPIEFAVIVLDKVTKNSKGSAFVKFQTQEAALKCVESCEQLPGANLAAPTTKAKKGANGASATEALNNLTLTIKGRPFRVDLAVDRDEAKRLKDDTSAKSGKDKRNLYLANEGLLVDSAVSLKRYGDAQKANNDMSDADREKRRRSQNEKKKKLVNPLYFVSPTRLSIRNLKKTVNHSELFNLCYKAAKAGLKNGLVEKRDMEEYLIAQSVPIRQRTPELLAIPKMEGVPQNQLVRKAKVMLDSSKLRGADKTAQSRGYGFVEFKHHAHALACLRELNHNALYGKEFATQYGAKGDKKHNLIVDFSLENYQKVVILNSRVEKRNLSQMSSSDKSKDDDDITDEVVDLDRKRSMAEANVGDIDDSVAEDNDGDENTKEKKSRYEKKLEHAQKRKAKEMKRKENKKRKLEEAGVVTATPTTNDVNKSKKSKPTKSKGGDAGDGDAAPKAAWGGFKRHRAKGKAK